MGVYSGPEIIEDGLILHLDASNARSYDPNGRYENLLNYSNNYSSSPGGWTLGSTGTRAQDIVGPDGVANSAWTITDNDNTGDLVQFYKQISITASSSTNYCISSFVKDVNGTGISPDFYVFFSGSSTKGSYINYNFSTDTITSFASDGGGIQPTIYGRILYPNGWVRIYFVVNDANNGSNTTLQYRIYPNGRGANTTGAMGLFGSQIEIGTFPTSYIPTEGSTKTRNPDNASITGSNFTEWYNQSEGTIYAQFKGESRAGSTGFVTKIVYSISDGSFNNSHYGVTPENNGDMYWFSRSSGVSQGLLGIIPLQPFASNFVYKSAYAIKTDDRALSINGYIDTDSIATLPVVNRLYIGSSWAGTSLYLGGHIAQLTYYPTRLPNSQLVSLTR
jgi:hypothetical protein